MESNAEEQPRSGPELDDSTPEKILGAAIRAAREERGFSQEDLARQMSGYGFNWNQGTVWKSERGRRPIRVNEVVAIAEVLGVEVAHLIGEARDEWSLRSRLIRIQARMRRLDERWSAAKKEISEVKKEHDDLGAEMFSLRDAYAAAHRKREARGSGKEGA